MLLMAKRVSLSMVPLISHCKGHGKWREIPYTQAFMTFIKTLNLGTPAESVRLLLITNPPCQIK